MAFHPGSRLIRIFERLFGAGGTRLKPGDPAPDFCLPDQEGKPFCLSDGAGRKQVLYFYPKDFTWGCTLQSCSLRDHYGELLAAGLEVTGISAGSVESHRAFRDTLRLPFRLLSDEDSRVAKLFGLRRTHRLAGREWHMTKRTTFVLDEQGVIRKVIDDIDTARHSGQILESIR
jgi:peroxiredoxin Q/BCP